MAVVGRIARPHGIRGQVVVNLQTVPGDALSAWAQLFIERRGQIETLRLTTVRKFQRDRPVIGIDGVETMNDAEALAGQGCACRLTRRRWAERFTAIT
jgi:16S rRNA processing protein RimM